MLTKLPLLPRTRAKLPNVMTTRFSVETALTLLDRSFSASEIDEDISEPQSGDTTIEDFRNSFEDGAGNGLVDYGDLSGHDAGVELEVQDSAGPSGALSEADNETAVTDPGSNGDSNDMEMEENEFDGADINNGLEPASDEESLEEDYDCPGDKSTGGGTDFDHIGDGVDDSTGSDTDGECEEQEQTPKSRRLKNPQKWKRNKRIRRRNSGRRYTSTTGKKVCLG